MLQINFLYYFDMNSNSQTVMFFCIADFLVFFFCVIVHDCLEECGDKQWERETLSTLVNIDMSLYSLNCLHTVEGLGPRRLK